MACTLVKCYRCHSDCESNVHVLITVDHMQLCSLSIIQKKKRVLIPAKDSGSREHGRFAGSSPQKCHFMQRSATSKPHHCFSPSVQQTGARLGGKKCILANCCIIGLHFSPENYPLHARFSERKLVTAQYCAVLQGVSTIARVRGFPSDLQQNC